MSQYRHRPIENVIEYLRSHLAIQEQELEENLGAIGVKHIKEILANEAEILDLEIRRLQLDFAYTFLSSPIEGTITAIYKDVGERVEPGEPVLRVENDKELYLVGAINYRGPLRLTKEIDDGHGGKIKRPLVTITSKDIFETGKTMTLSDVEIVSIRGHEVDDDEWDVIFRCNNPIQGGERILPINYQFDRSTTEIQIVMS